MRIQRAEDLVAGTTVVPAELPSTVSSRWKRVLRPRSGWQAVDFGELWSYRELLWMLALRDIKVRYKQTALGVAWAVLQPVSTVLVFTTLFFLMGRAPSGRLPYPVAMLTAMLPWQLFASVVGQAGNSLVNNQALLKKVYFPRLIIPLSTVLSALADFLLAALVLAALMAWYGIAPGWNVVALPGFLLLAIAAALAGGIWLSALNLRFRDFRHLIPLLVQLGMFVSPVVYTTTAVIPERWRFLYGLNPMAGVIEGFRWALLGRAEPPGPVLLASIAATLLLLAGGLLYFRRVEKDFADLA